MVKEVIKRDGRKVIFDKKKIENVVLAAFRQVDNKVAEINRQKAKEIANYIANLESESMSVEEIQDVVEQKLMGSKRKDVARAFIIYRNDRTRLRDMNSNFFKVVGEKISAKNVQNQNANVDEKSFGGRMGEATDELLRKYAMDSLLSTTSRENHEKNRVYIHDLSHYALGDHNCLSIPFDKLLANGFNTRQTDVRAANSVNTAFQLLAVIFQLQSLQQFGGVSATHLDWTMIPYIRKSFTKHLVDGMKYIEKTSEYKSQRFLKWLKYDNHSDGTIHFSDVDFKEIHQMAWEYAMDMTVRETQQAVEGMYHNLNTLQSRSGNQLPFTSINYGTCTEDEGRLVTKSLLQGLIKGVGKFHKTSVFPCGIFQYMNGVNNGYGTKNYDLFRLALKCTAQRLYPNYANVDWSGNSGYDKNDPQTYFSTMGCRTANGFDINGFGQLKDGRGNICPSTIILPTLAMESRAKTFSEGGNVIDNFMDILDKTIEETKDSLIERFEYICSQSPDSAKFMYENGLMEGYIPEEGIRSALKHGTLAIGQIGLAETLQILIGKDHTTKDGMELAKRIEQLFKKKCAEYKQKYKLNFGVYYTPAENLCYTAMKKFKIKYGEIKNVSDKDFFTNSIHVPVWVKIDPFTKIDIESQLTGYSNAGCITYVELESSAKNNIDALEKLVTYAMNKDIPYFAINVPNDTCMNCGYTDEISDACPKCGSKKIHRLRRVTGYLTGDYETAFNLGKQQEVNMRYKHGKKIKNWIRW